MDFFYFDWQLVWEEKNSKNGICLHGKTWLSKGRKTLTWNQPFLRVQRLDIGLINPMEQFNLRNLTMYQEVLEKNLYRYLFHLLSILINASCLSSELRQGNLCATGQFWLAKGFDKLRSKYWDIMLIWSVNDFSLFWVLHTTTLLNL